MEGAEASPVSPQDDFEALIRRVELILEDVKLHASEADFDELQGGLEQLAKITHEPVLSSTHGKRNRWHVCVFRSMLQVLGIVIDTLLQGPSLPEPSPSATTDSTAFKVLQPIFLTLSRISSSNESGVRSPTAATPQPTCSWASVESLLREKLLAEYKSPKYAVQPSSLLAWVFDALLRTSLQQELKRFVVVKLASVQEGTVTPYQAGSDEARDTSLRAPESQLESVSKSMADEDLGLDQPILNPWPARTMLMLSLRVMGREATTELADSDKQDSHTIVQPVPIAHRALAVLCKLAMANDRNLVLMQSVGALVLSLQAYFELPTSTFREQLRIFIIRLMTVGFENVESARGLIASTISDHSDTSLLLDALDISNQPPHFVFDMFHTGHASLEIPELRQDFPPSDSSAGYTLMFWLRVDKYDDQCHTTLFGAFDNSQTCFILLYLERRHRTLVLQTSVKSKDPSVRFRDAHFEEGVLYHIALVHRKSRQDGGGKALLYVNGVLREQARCSLPLPSALVQVNHAARGPTRAPAPVQAFFGTPQALSPDPRPRTLHSKWSLCTAHLINLALPADLFYVYCKLGPFYSGNFQDSLSSFQTYEASTMVNMAKERQSFIQGGAVSNAVKAASASLIPESSILISMSPTFVRYHGQDLYSAQSRHGMPLSNGSTVSPPMQVVVGNAASPSLTKFASRRTATGSLMGGALSITPLTLQDCSWRFLGCVPLALGLVARSTTSAQLFNAVKIYFASFRSSWRNSEAMERGSGYGTLSWLLRVKFSPQAYGPSDDGPAGIARVAWLSDEEREATSTGLLHYILSSTILKYDSKKQALISNPLAYRMLVIDNDVWQESGSDAQLLYLTQLCVLMLDSEHHLYNAKRLLRMRVMKRLIEIMKSGNVAAATHPDLLKTVQCLLEESVSPDTLRSLALYITFALNRLPVPILDQKAPGIDTNNTSSVSADGELGVLLLQSLKDILTSKANTESLRRFARSVTTKWLVYLLESDDGRVVDAALAILCRMYMVVGDSFRSKFESRHGFILLSQALRKWACRETVWLAMLSLLFGIYPDHINVRSLGELGQYLTSRPLHKVPTIACSQAWDVTTEMFEEGLLQHSAAALECSGSNLPKGLADRAASRPADLGAQGVEHSSEQLRYVFGLISALFSHVEVFRDFVLTREPIRALLHALVRALTESNHPSSADFPSTTQTSRSLLHPDDATTTPTPSFLDPTRHRRVSEFVILESSKRTSASTRRFSKPLAPSHRSSDKPTSRDACFNDFQRLLVSISLEQVIGQKDLIGLGLFLKAPDVSSSIRSVLTSSILSDLLCLLEDRIETDVSLFHSSKPLTNIVRFLQQCSEAAIEGWFVDTTYSLLRCMSAFLRRLDHREIRKLKSVRLCAPLMGVIRHTLLDLALFHLAVSHEDWESQSPNTDHSKTHPGTDTIAHANDTPRLYAILRKTSLVTLAITDLDSTHDGLNRSDPRLIPAFCFLLMSELVVGRRDLLPDVLEVFRQLAAANFSDISSCLKATGHSELNTIATRILRTIMREDDEAVVVCITEHRESLNVLLSDVPRASLDSIIHETNSSVEAQATLRLQKRQERLNTYHLQDIARQHAITEHEAELRTWNENIVDSESSKYSRSRQDKQESASHFCELYRKCADRLTLINVSEDQPAKKWSLDECEGKDRMRLRLAPSMDGKDEDYQPKRSARRGTVVRSAAKHGSGEATHRRTMSAAIKPEKGTSNDELDGVSDMPDMPESARPDSLQTDDDGFEMVYGPNPRADADDKNRKVMRSLQQGEQVHEVYNVSRIRGLEACEGLLIIGAKALYLVDNLFQRGDSEIVNTVDAPREERDPYVQMISGRDMHRQRSRSSDQRTETRHWTWHSVISISKRDFLLRPVAIEVFFEDGRSYLLTASSTNDRDKIFANVIDRAKRVSPSSAATIDADAWRFEQLVSMKEPTARISSRFASALRFGSSFPATERWLKGEISNFQYLMLVNTLAGRTFNDLTQYPVFPWVLADYTSEILDLNNPRSFRDLTKPMGCQHPDREAAFRDRYKTFADMSDDNTTAFHYGTHYSTAMIVTSYMIRLQPYVDAYLLLQGGSFDHADRLFYSVEKAWTSASQTNMTDVRELIPEFFYLPEMFTNINGYDFGRREANGELISDVKLPPWAKGDPKLFIAKHREALESPYVTQNLHYWIDLVFGFKQKGEAAVEATNVFHHLSYQGAADLDTIEDPMERLATIGIIHNFGQTPRDVFASPHERRDPRTSRSKQLQHGIDSLNISPTIIFQYHNPIHEINYVAKHQRVVCTGPARANMHSLHGLVVDWGYVDGSVRFWKADAQRSQPLGIYEQLHQERISAAVCANTKLVTSSHDCTLGVWNVSSPSNAEAVELQPETFLFGHREPITVLAVSPVLGVILSADLSGRILLWDLNTHALVRDMQLQEAVTCAKIHNTSGHIVMTNGHAILLYSINFELIIEQKAKGANGDLLSRCCFYESSGNEWTHTELILTGHTRGVANIWKLVHDETWSLQLVRRLDHVDRSSDHARNVSATITAIHATDTSVYTGDEIGRVFEWKCTKFT